MTEALKAQSLREEELTEGKRRLAVLRAEAAAQPAPEPPCPGTDELTHLRRQVAQMEGELRQSHRAVSEKSLVESTLKQQVEHLMQEVSGVEGSCAASRWDGSSRNGIGHRVSSVRVSLDGGNRQETFPHH